MQDVAEAERGLTLVAAVAMEDPLRPDVTASIAQCQRQGTAHAAIPTSRLLRPHAVLSWEDGLGCFVIRVRE